MSRLQRISKGKAGRVQQAFLPYDKVISLKWPPSIFIKVYGSLMQFFSSR